MPTLAKAAIPGSVFWPLLLGAAVTLVGTVLAQWLSLAYQTSRQRQARRADRQETRLLALQDLLGEVDDCASRAMAHRSELSNEYERDPSPDYPEDWGPFLHTSLSEMETLRSLTYRLRLLAAGIEHKPLRMTVDDIAQWAWLAPTTPSDQRSADTYAKLIEVQNDAVDLLGEQLRKLP
jgi:hypothetical protein